jgi:hypothetical protein
MSFNVITVVSDQARQRISEMFRNGKSFQITSFSVSDGGHSLGDPTVALAPNPAAVTLPQNTFSYGPQAINSSSMVSAFCDQFTCILTNGQANGPISSIGLYATIISSPVLDDPDVGQPFLFSVGNFPLRVKTVSDQFSFSCLLQL